MGPGGSLPRLIAALTLSGALPGLTLMGGGCGKDGEDTGFRVVGSYPADGADDVVVSVLPEFRLSGAPDEDACVAGGLGFAAIGEDGAIAYEVSFSAEIPDSGEALRFAHDAPLTANTTYALYVEAAGDNVCVDTGGHPLRPFGIEFTVP